MTLRQLQPGESPTDYASLEEAVGAIRSSFGLGVYNALAYEEPAAPTDPATLQAHVDLIRSAREDSPTIDRMMDRHPGVIKLLARYGICTTLGVARESGGYWRHHGDRGVGRKLGRMASRARISLATTPSYRNVKPLDYGVEVAKALVSPVDMRIDDVHVREPRRARWGKRKGQVVDGTVAVDRVTYTVRDLLAFDLMEDTLQGLVRSGHVQDVYPLRTRTHGQPTVGLNNHTEYSERESGAISWELLRQILAHFGFKDPRDKRSLADTTETFPPVLHRLFAELNWAYLAIPVAIYEDGELVGYAKKDPGHLIQEAGYCKQPYRDTVRDAIKKMRGKNSQNKELHPSRNLIFVGRDRLRRRRVNLGKPQLGPAPVRLRHGGHIAADYFRDVKVRFKEDPAAFMLEAIATAPKGLQDLALGALKLIPKIAVGIWWLGHDAVTWRKEKRAARKDTTIDDLIEKLQADLRRMRQAQA